MKIQVLLGSAAVCGALAAGPALAQEPFLDVGEQAPITILINSSPWFAGFEEVVDLYEEQTGNEVELDVTPYNGMLEKARNAVRDSRSPYDLINLDTQWTIEFYEGGFLTPLKSVDPDFELPEQVLRYDDSGYWNAEKRWRTSDGGELMTYSPNGNIHLLFYRGDLFEEAGLQAPETWGQVTAACDKLKTSDLYGYVARGERGNPIRFDWMPFMLGHGASIVKDPENGDYTVTINSPEAQRALDTFIDLATRCGPPNIGSLGQGDLIQLLSTGKAVQGQAVTAAWPSFEDPQKSAVVGKLQPAVMPRPEDGQPGVVIGNWHLGIPQNLPEEQKRAALAFSKWFLTEGAQRAYAEAGAIPVRTDVLQSDLAERPEHRWMKPYLDSMPHARQVLGYAEGAAVEEALGLRLNQALIGEMSSAAALNAAASDIAAIFERSGRKTGTLPPLDE